MFHGATLLSAFNYVVLIAVLIWETFVLMFNI